MSTPLVNTVESAIEAEALLPDGSPCLVGVSGGVDSMVLFRILSELVGPHAWRLTVGHFNHRMRGDASDADAALVAETAKTANVPLQQDSADAAAWAAERGWSIEMAARDLRHRFFVRAARRVGATRVVLAHHADDQVELFFLRLFRGAGSDGLSGMRWDQASPMDPAVRLVRPLLGVPKAALVAYADARSVVHREDESNRSTDILRNRIRTLLLPLLESDYTPALREQVLRSMKLLAGEHEWLETEAQAWMESQPEDGFESLAAGLQREVIRLGLFALGVAGDFRLIEALRRAVPGQGVAGPNGRRLGRDHGGRVSEVPTESLSFCSERLMLELEAEGDCEVTFGGITLSVAVRSAAERARSEVRPEALEWFDADAVGSSCVLRYWQPGDRYQPIGLKGHVKLQDWFVNEKVPPVDRRKKVVAESEALGIFWIEGMRIAEWAKVRGDSRRVLRWAWCRASEK